MTAQDNRTANVDAGGAPACPACDSLLARLEARPKLAPTQLKALAAETRRILVEYGLCDFDTSSAIIPSDDPLVRI